MYTQCDGCATLFRVTVRQLRTAHGRVRCCLCHGTFDALASLVDRLPPDLPVDEEHRYRPPAADAGTVAAAPEPEQDMFAFDDMLDGPEADRGDDPSDELFIDLDLRPELEAAPPPTGREGSRWRTGLIWSAGIVLLIVLLLVQYAYIRRDSLAQDARLRPWLEAMCGAARCEQPLLRDLDNLHVLQRRVMAHPSRDDALLVRASLVNDAAFPQPYPEVRLRFFDRGGRVTAERWFTPSEYLEEQRLRAHIEEGMPPMQPIAVELELVDPGQGAADGFDIEFR